MTKRAWLAVGWCVAVGVAVGVRLWNALAGPRMWGYDAWGHVAYVLFLDLYRAVPWADQGWSYFHPPLHYALGWLLAQAHSAEVLMRGLALLSSAASLGIALLAARMVRWAQPERPALALAGFVAVAALPVHYTVSPMPGNELTEACLSAAALTLFVANERRPNAGLRGAFAVGAVSGLCLLTKFSGLLVVVVACASLALRVLLRGAFHEAPARAGARALIIAGTAALVCAPYYARNIAAFGTPFQLSRDFPLIAQVERDQPPGARSWLDYVRFPLAAFRDPNPLAPHLLHSVWASAYLNVWADTYRESDVSRALVAERGRQRSTQIMAWLGLLPTATAFAGGALAARDVRRGRRRGVYVPLLLQATAALAAFALFAWRVPLWSALKASYLLPLSLPYAAFVARGLEGLARLRAPWPGWLAAGGLVAAALAASAVATTGLVLPRRADAPATGAVRFYFGEYDEARRVYGRLAQQAAYPVPWLDNLAAIELAEGRPSRARRLYARALALEQAAGRHDPYRAGQLALATALDGDLPEARRLLDAELAQGSVPELLANRGAIRAVAGDPAGARDDLRAALAAAPSQLPAWLDLARVDEALGDGAEAAAARARAAQVRCTAPRGYPYGVGTGEVLEWGVGRRGLLLLGDDGLRLAPPSFFRRTCE